MFTVGESVAADGLGGAAAIGTTPDLAEAVEAEDSVVVAFSAPLFAEPCVVDDGGLSEPLTLSAFVDVGVVAGVCWTEFLRLGFLDERVEAAPTGILLPLPRLRFLITSVLSDSGRTTP